MCLLNLTQCYGGSEDLEKKYLTEHQEGQLLLKTKIPPAVSGNKTRYMYFLPLPVAKLGVLKYQTLTKSMLIGDYGDDVRGVDWCAGHVG